MPNPEAQDFRKLAVEWGTRAGDISEDHAIAFDKWSQRIVSADDYYKTSAKSVAEIRTIISEIDAQSVPAEWSRSIKLFKTALEFYIVIERSRDFVSGNLRSVDPAIEAYQSFSRYLEESKRAMPN